MLPLAAFPATFQADVELWLDRLAGKAGLDVGPVRPLRPATITKWRFALRQLASALVQRGREPATLTSLADLVIGDAPATILGFFLERAGNRPCAQTQGLAARLKAIAEHHVGVAPAALAQLQRMAQRLTLPVQGMTDKNRNTLRQFADPAMQRRLVNLPAELFARLLTSCTPPKQLALRLQSALAVELLLVAPMRLKNLAALELDQHLRRSGNGRHTRWFVMIPGAEVKNGETLELPLPERTVRLLETYRARILPVLAEPGAMWLFPGLRGSKKEVSLGPQISKFIRRELGCRLSTHQFRHLCGYLYLQRHPHGHEVVRAMLGHRSIETTIKFYAGLEGMAAARHYDAMLQELISAAAAPQAPAMTAAPGGSHPRCLPLAAWPAADRLGWQQATAKGNLLLDDGPGAALRPNTLRRHRSSYGRWLASLADRGRLDPDLPAGARATPAAIAAYVAELQAHNAPGTVLVRLQSLAVVLRWLAPEQERPWLQRVLARLKAIAQPVRDKRGRLQRTDDLLALGRQLMAQAEAGAGLRPRAQARLYRDGLMIACLAYRPLRLANFIGLELGRHLHRRGTGWWLEIPAAETKTRNAIVLPFPEPLVPALEVYLARWRPQLAPLGQTTLPCPALWLTEQNCGISPSHAHLRITRHTRAAFGRPVSPHGFRDALATTVAINSPEQMGIVTPLLGHSGPGTAQRHYNLARAMEAATAWHDTLASIADQG